jgi:flavin reductase (DIM6/NTAB) family NADH-FMN oxidoreductase RutF
VPRLLPLVGPLARLVTHAYYRVTIAGNPVPSSGPLLLVANHPNEAFDPLLVALSVNPKHASWPLLVGGGGFAVSVLRRDQLHLAEVFGTSSGRETDKLAGVRWGPAPSGAPVLAEAITWLDCRLHARFPAGDHEIVLARPVAGELVAPDAAPLLYPDTGELDGSRELYPRSLG